MKKLLLLSLIMCSVSIVQAQKVYFMYLQSENKTPFYVRMGDKVMSSAAEGYLIVPKLTDSTYSFAVGQPGKRNEAQFSINISKADRGFLIREVEGSISLFDLQSLSTYKSIAPPASTSQSIRKKDQFTALLAKAVDDTTLLYQAVLIQPQKPAASKTEPLVAKENTKPPAAPKETTIVKEDTVTTPPPAASVADAAVKKEDSAIAASVPKDTIATKDTAVAMVAQTKSEATPTTSDKDSVVAASAPVATTATAKSAETAAPVIEETKDMSYKRSTVIKKSESSMSSGFGLVFLDNFEGGVDTISLTIPNPSYAINSGTERVNENKQFLDMAITTTSDSAKKPEDPKKGVAQIQKPACTNMASDDDFFKLRRDMAAEKEEDNMISQAKKYFRNKCFRTEHIKYLSTLFLTDAGKYRFFDAAYFHVYDQEKFETLQGEMKEAYYINRFKALVAN